MHQSQCLKGLTLCEPNKLLRSIDEIKRPFASKESSVDGEQASDVNPINWKRDDTYASVKENLGSLTVEGKLVTPGIADARIDTVRGSVVVTTVDAKLYGIPADGAPLFGPESYHLHDYGFFYNNFKQNVADRIKSYLTK